MYTGDIHDLQPDYDEIRELYLLAQGFHVLRFRNEEVLQDIDCVLSQIECHRIKFG